MALLSVFLPWIEKATLFPTGNAKTKGRWTRTSDATRHPIWGFVETDPALREEQTPWGLPEGGQPPMANGKARNFPIKLPGTLPRTAPPRGPQPRHSHRPTGS